MMFKRRYDINDIKINYNNSFIQEETSHRTLKKKHKRNTFTEFTGDQAKQIYDDIINKTPVNKKIYEVRKTKNKKELINNKERKNDVIDDKTLQKIQLEFLKYAATGNTEELNSIIKDHKNKLVYKDILNYCDTFGWNALLCAAAEGHLDIVNILLEEGCVSVNWKLFKEVCTKRSQETIYSHVLSRLKPYGKRNNLYSTKCTYTSTSTSTNNGVDNSWSYCDVCGEKYLLSQKQKHESSMIHIFKDKSTVKTMYGISEHNVGFQMMLRNGWKVDKGLGPSGVGRKNPIKTVLKQNRAGLGLQKDEIKKVTHFSANDKRAVQTKSVLRKYSKIRFFDRKTLETKKKKEKCWEQNMRQYMSAE